MASSSAWALGILRTQIGASVQFSSTVRCGNRLKCWNTMPTSRRTASMFFRLLVSSTPSTTIWPRWCSSSRLMQRIRVDLPEPEGPQMTIRSPRLTVRLMPFRTWNSPYHLWTSIRSIAISSPGRGAPVAFASLMHGLPICLMPRSSFVAAMELRLEPLAVLRHEEAEDEVDQRHEQVRLLVEAAPRRVGQRRLRCAHQVEQADDDHQRRVLEEADESIDQQRNGDRQGLRQDDLTGLLPIAEAKAVGRLVLPLGNRLKAGTDDF